MSGTWHGCHNGGAGKQNLVHMLPVPVEVKKMFSRRQPDIVFVLFKIRFLLHHWGKPRNSLDHLGSLPQKLINPLELESLVVSLFF